MNPLPRLLVADARFIISSVVPWTWPRAPVGALCVGGGVAGLINGAARRADQQQTQQK
jgi:hypothetical protein